MLFNSLSFVLLFPVVCAIYYILPRSMRNIYLLLFSIAFYMMWNVAFSLFLFWVTASSFCFGIVAEKHNNKVSLWSSIIITLLPLAFFKYFNFLNQVIADALQIWNFHVSMPGLNWVIPVGISFYTFQALGYIVDVYKGKVKAEHDFLPFSLFVCFFPQLLSGPISRAESLLPQFKNDKKQFNYDLAVRGAGFLVWGMFLKVVVADRLGLFVDTVFDNPDSFSGMTLLFSACSYSFQIYTDFAGYTLLAIGCANIMGFQLPDNFHRPYFSIGFRDFWRRWHITLSGWLRDYIYIPLGGSRCPKAKTYSNLLTTFLVSGLWHGADYTFIVWGLLHGVFVCIDRALDFPRQFRRKISKIAAVMLTFLLVTLLWILFRAPNIRFACHVVTKIFTDYPSVLQIPDNRDMKATVLTMSLMVAIVISKDVYDEFFSKYRMKTAWKWTGYLTLVMLILMFGVFDAGQFIYFNF